MKTVSTVFLLTQMLENSYGWGRAEAHSFVGLKRATYFIGEMGQKRLNLCVWLRPPWAL